MTEKIHYEDNIFYLTVMVRFINDGLKLSIDADFFAEKVLEDILFIDTTIQKLYGSLKNNTHLIRRDVYLHTLMKLKKSYGHTLETLLASEGNFTSFMVPMFSKLRRCLVVHLNDVNEIREQLVDAGTSKMDSELISNDELHLLMSSMEEEEGGSLDI